jgi:hypothetical protein
MPPQQLGERYLIAPVHKRFQQLSIGCAALVVAGRQVAQVLKEDAQGCAAHGCGSRKWSPKSL